MDERDDRTTGRELLPCQRPGGDQAAGALERAPTVGQGRVRVGRAAVAATAKGGLTEGTGAVIVHAVIVEGRHTAFDVQTAPEERRPARQAKLVGSGVPIGALAAF